MTDVIPVSASASWFKWAKSESENVPVKELLLKLAELDCFWVQSFREYTNQVRAHARAELRLAGATLSYSHLFCNIGKLDAISKLYEHVPLIQTSFYFEQTAHA